MMDSGFLKDFSPVSLEGIDSLSLMNRTDSKCIFHAKYLPEVLGKISPHYQVLEINSERLMPYHSVYFDTPDYFLYKCHHNGVRSRYKVRLRDYLISNRSFFEIKRKTNKNKTKKKRMEVPFKTEEIYGESIDFLKFNSPLGNLALVRNIENYFTRITLAGFASNERVTLDLNMEYRINGRKLAMQDLVIAEIKRGQNSKNSPIQKSLREMRISDCGFSKYCIGIVSLVDGVKYNNFKPKLITLKKILG